MGLNGNPRAGAKTIRDKNLNLGYVHQECDSRYTDHVPTTFDPRCRVWYQDAIEDGNTDIIFTRPYLDQGSGTLIVSVAAPVFDSTDPSLLLGVVALDMDFTSEIETSITDLRVVGDDGYAYLLAAGDDGSVAVHKDLDKTTPQVITELELGVDEAEFAAIIARMTESCDGSETYAKGGDPWILSWQHETVSNGSDGSCVGGFVLVVTVRESDLLEVRRAETAGGKRVVKLWKAGMDVSSCFCLSLPLYRYVFMYVQRD